MLKGLVGIWQALRCFNKIRKGAGSKTEIYFTKKRALQWRFQGEVWARRIADGNLDGLPSVLRWIFALTTADEALAEFFQHLIKSDKLATGDKALNQHLYQTH